MSLPFYSTNQMPFLFHKSVAFLIPRPNVRRVFLIPLTDCFSYSALWLSFLFCKEIQHYEVVDYPDSLSDDCLGWHIAISICWDVVLSRRLCMMSCQEDRLLIEMSWNRTMMLMFVNISLRERVQCMCEWTMKENVELVTLGKREKVLTLRFIVPGMNA